jgi:N-methylhydantoinase A
VRLRIGIDVGGTFTDLTGLDEEAGEVVLTRKYHSDPARPGAVMAAITRELEAEFGADAVSLVLHGSTVALNTLLEEKGVAVGLLTTRGFRDVYEIGRQWRGDQVFDIFAHAPRMLLTRDRIFEIGERLDARGIAIEPLSAGDVEAAVRALAAQGVEAVAIAFLFAYADPGHEQEAARIARALAPELYLSLSSEVNPEWREYERTASTVANAYIGPPVARYLHDIERLCVERFPAARVLMMKSDGGAASARMLARAPIQTILSGPVAGVIGSRFLGDVKSIENLISFDTGGTSSDMAVIPGRPLYRSEVAVARHPVRTRTVDIETIGAGGGSIASVQLGGVLKVGPRSAGADPGPACYDRGGGEATLTDALVVLGHLNQAALLDGAMPIAAAKAEEAVRERIARPLGLSCVAAASGILRVLASNVVAAMRTITVERGYDPREFTLVAFGGMGPTIAGLVATELGIGRILVPRDPGAFSAWGMLVTDVQQENSLTRITPLEGATAAALEAVFRGIEDGARAELVAERFAPEGVAMLRHAGMRYSSQSYEVSVAVPPLDGPSSVALLARRFHEAHHRRYGHMAEDEPVEIVNFGVTAVGALAKPSLPRRAPAATSSPPPPHHVRDVHFADRAAARIPVYRRAGLAPGMRLAGPAIIEEQTSTTVIYPGQRASIDDTLDIEIEVG